MNRFVLALGVSVLSLATVPAASQVMDSNGRPLSPEAGRQLNAKIASLERTSGLQAATIAGIANRLGLQYSGLSATALFSRLDSQVAEAVKLRDRISSLEDTITNLNDPLIRDPGLAIVARAQDAFEKAEFDRAELALGELAFLRQDESAEAQKAWIEAVQSQARAAELQGGEADFDRAYALEESAKALEITRSRRALFDLSLSQMERGLREGTNFGRRRGLERAIATFETELSGNDAYPQSSQAQLDANTAYVEALSLFGRRVGGEERAVVAEKARSHLVEYGTNAFPGGVQEYPFVLKRVAVELTNQTIDLLDVEKMSDNPLDYDLGLAVLEDFFTKFFAAVEGTSPLKELGRENVVMMAGSLEAFSSLLQHPAVIQAIELGDAAGAGPDSPTKDELTEISGMTSLLSAITGLVALGEIDLLGGGSADDREMLSTLAISDDPVLWLNTAISIARTFSSAPSLEQVHATMELPPMFSVDWQLDVARKVLLIAKDSAESQGYLVHLAEIENLLGVVAREVSQRAPADQKAAMLQDSIARHNAALALLDSDELPIERAESLLDLSQSFAALSILPLPERCQHVDSARTAAHESASLFAERGIHARAAEAKEVIAALEALPAECPVD
ncbi:hypothetical protein AAG593_04210 [Citromicrobium bathyomarinum]